MSPKVFIPLQTLIMETQVNINFCAQLSQLQKRQYKQMQSMTSTYLYIQEQVVWECVGVGVFLKQN